MDSSSEALGVEVPEYLKKNLKVLLYNLPAPNVSKEAFYNRYKVRYGETVDFNRNNYIEVLSLLPDLVKIEADKVTRTVLVNPVKSDSKKQINAATPGGRDINQELIRRIELENVRDNNVLARIESFVTQLKKVELSGEEKFSLEKISLRLEKILQDKEVAPPVSVRLGMDPVSTKTNTMFEDEKNMIPGKEINSAVHPKIKVDQMKRTPTPEVQSNRTNSKNDLSDVKLWSRAALIPRDGHKGVRWGIGLCYLKRSKRLVVTCMKGKMDQAENGKVKMFTSDGRFLKVVTCAEADDGDLTDPSAVASLADGGFAVSDKTRVLVFDEDGKYIKTVWSRKDESTFQTMECFGLGQDIQKRLVLLLDSRDKTFLCFIDSQKSEIFCSNVRDIVKAPPKSNFKFLTVVGHSCFVTDYFNNKVYGLKFSDERKLVKDVEISGKFLKKPSGVTADSEGNIIVADYSEDGKLAVFSDKGKWLKNIEVSLLDKSNANCLISLKRL